MKIECTIQRQGGSTVTLGTTDYHFSPLADGCHVAQVEPIAHQDKLLSIPEAYRLYRGDGEVLAAPVEAAPAPQLHAATEETIQHVALFGSSSHPGSFTIHGKDYSLGDVVNLAYVQSGLPTEGWNQLSDDTRADLIDAELDKLNANPPDAFDALDATLDTPAAPEVAEPGVDAMTPEDAKAALVAEYKAVFNKPPHYNLGVEKMRALIDAQLIAKN